jgi:hypothetical protein
MTSRESFEKWALAHGYNLEATQLGFKISYTHMQTATSFHAWQACIALHEAEIEILDSAYKVNKNGYEQTFKQLNDAQDKITALELSNKQLREALEDAINLRVITYRWSDMEGDTDSWSDEKIVNKDEYARKWYQALSTQPTDSLDECSSVVKDKYWSSNTRDELLEAIRNLKKEV